MDLNSALLSTVITVAIGFLCVMVSTRIGLGSLIGFLVTGVIIGPYTKGFVLTNDVDSLRSFSELGVVFLLFLIGLEMQPRKLWALRREILGLGTSQMLGCAALLALILFAVGNEWRGATVVGLMLAMSSTAFVMQILSDRKESDLPHGRMCFSILLFQDLAIVPIMALTQALSPFATGPSDDAWEWEVVLKFAVLGGIYLFGLYIVPFGLRLAARYRSDDATIGAVFFAVLGSAILTEHMGLSMALGAFLIGVALSTSKFHHQVAAVVRPHKQIAMALFFISVGMSINVGAISQNPLSLSIMVPLVVVLKTGMTYWICRRFGHGRRDSLRAAMYLSQAGEFGFVLAGAATKNGILSGEDSLIVFLSIAISMVTTPLLARLADRFAPLAVPTTPAGLSSRRGAAAIRRVLVAGCGPAGRVVCQALGEAGIPYTAMDNDPNAVARAAGEGLHVLCADATDSSVLAKATKNGARTLILTFANPDQVYTTAETWRAVSQEGALFALLPDAEQAHAFQGKFSATVIPRGESCGLIMAEVVLSEIGTAQETAAAILNVVRKSLSDTKPKDNNA